MKKYNLAGIGEVLWDLLPTGKQLGGAPANFSFHCKQLKKNQVNAFLISCIGSDEAGQEIKQAVNELGISTQFLFQHAEYPTGQVNVTLDKKNNASYTIQFPSAWDYLPEINSQTLPHFDAVCFGSLAQRNQQNLRHIRKFIRGLPRTTLKIFDLNLRQLFYTPSLIQDSLKLANGCKFNEQEMYWLADICKIEGSQQYILESLAQRFELELLALTKGAQGCAIYFKGDFVNIPGIKTDVCDTVGAGDAFTAAVCLGVLQDYPTLVIAENANQLASYVCSQTGATPKIPEQLDFFI